MRKPNKLRRDDTDTNSNNIKEKEQKSEVENTKNWKGV